MAHQDSDRVLDRGGFLEPVDEPRKFGIPEPELAHRLLASGEGAGLWVGDVLKTQDVVEERLLLAVGGHPVDLAAAVRLGALPDRGNPSLRDDLEKLLVQLGEGRLEFDQEMRSAALVEQHTAVHHSETQIVRLHFEGKLVFHTEHRGYLTLVRADFPGANAVHCVVV